MYPNGDLTIRIMVSKLRVATLSEEYTRVINKKKLK